MRHRVRRKGVGDGVLRESRRVNERVPVISRPAAFWRGTRTPRGELGGLRLDEQREEEE